MRLTLRATGARSGAGSTSRQIEGYGGSIRYPFTTRLALEGAGHVYQVIGARDNKIKHYKAGVKFGLTSSNSINLGAEWVNWDWAVGGANRERYYNIGWGHDLDAGAFVQAAVPVHQLQRGRTPGGAPGVRLHRWRGRGAVASRL